MADKIWIESYKTFGIWWQAHVNSQGVSLLGNRFPYEANKYNAHYTLNSKIHLPNWPYRSSSGKPSKKNVDILIVADELFSTTRPYTILSSSVTVSYYEIIKVNSSAKALSTVRFDHDQSIHASHPFFHLHFEQIPVDLGQGVIESWKYTVEFDDTKRGIRFRIPTPHMGLCSVLLGIAADHLEHAAFKSLWEKLREIDWQPPLPSKNNLWKQCNPKALEDVPFHSWQWYFWP